VPKENDMKTSERRKDLNAKSPEELNTELHALLREQFGLRMQKATQQLTNTAKLTEEIGMPNASARADASSSHCASSTTHRSGCSSAASDSRPSRASPTRNGLDAGPALRPNATSSASR